MQGWVLRIGVVLAASAPVACSLFIDTGGFASGGTSATIDGGNGDAPLADVATDAPLEAAPFDSGLAKYPATILEDKPILYYRFEETSGSTVRDETSNWPGTANAITFGAPGAFAGSLAISLDGTKGAIHAGAVGDFVGTQSFSAECWVKPTSNDGEFRHPFSKDIESAQGTDRQQWGFFVYLGRIAFERYVDNQGVQASTGSLPLDTWYHAVGTYDGKQMVLYINGVQAKVLPDARSAKPKPVPLYIAAKAPTEGHLKGSLDEVAIYDKALTPERVKAHFDAAKP